MLKILTIICILASVLSAVILMSWLKSKRGHGEKAARLLSVIRNRNASFKMFQLPSVIVTTVIIAVAVGRATGWTNAAAYFAGAVVCFAAIFITSDAFLSGAMSSYNSAVTNDVPASVKCSYRSGAVVGFIVSAAGLALLASIFLKIGDKSFLSFAAPYALGASTIAIYLHVGGYVYSASYSRAVSDKDFTDVSGYIYGSGADLFESYVLAAASAIMLADLAVATSGVTSTFTSEAPAKYPLIVYASGIVASMIGTLLYRGGSQKKTAGNPILVCYAAGILTSAAAVYFSNYMMQSLVYAFATMTGIAVGLITGSISVYFTGDSKLMIANAANDKKLGRYSRAVFNMGTGMISSGLYIVLMIVAVAVSFNFASYYGIALCAVGFCSITACIGAVDGLSILTKSTSEILSSGSYTNEDGQDETLRNEISDMLGTASIRTNASAKAFSTTSAFLASAAMLSAIFYLSESGTIRFLSEKSISVLLGATGGAASVFILLGFVITSVRVTGTVAIRNMGKISDDSVASFLRGSLIPSILSIAFPASVGLLFGFKVLWGFLAGAIFTGYVLTTSLNNSGRYFENTAVQSLGSLIKMMVVFSAVFMFTIIKIGGFIH